MSFSQDSQGATGTYTDSSWDCGSRKKAQQIPQVLIVICSIEVQDGTATIYGGPSPASPYLCVSV